jgi:hypothetical protein
MSDQWDEREFGEIEKAAWDEAQDAWDEHVRHLEEAEQDRLTRDAGESGR